MRRPQRSARLPVAAAVALLLVAGGSGALRAQSFRIYPSAVTQTEPFLVLDPACPDTLFASSNTINLNTGFISEGVYVSMDGGSSWRGSDTCNGFPVTFHRGDPAITITRAGVFILLRLGFSPGIYAHTSADRGVTWSAQTTLTTADADRPSIAADAGSASPYAGRTYAAWVRLAPPYPVVVSTAGDSGKGWSAAAPVNSPSKRGQGAQIIVGPGGVVYCCWASVGDLSPFTEDSVGFARSTDGGTLWDARERAYDMNGIAGTLPQKGNIRVNGLPRIDVDRSGGPRTGWIYIVTTERGLAPAGNDPDIILHRSADGGASWSAGVRVNQDAIGNGKNQYFPALAVDGGGGINVLYYDDRDVASDSATVYLSRSTDGGESWSDTRICEHAFQPLPIGGLGQGYQGDNIALLAAGPRLWPVWMDNASGIYQLWTRPVELTMLGASAPGAPLPSETRLYQNTPNPFNPSTTITYDLAAAGHVVLTVHNILGERVATLADGFRAPGRWSARFEADNLPGGVYFARLQAGAQLAVRKMLLVK